MNGQKLVNEHVILWCPGNYLCLDQAIVKGGRNKIDECDIEVSCLWMSDMKFCWTFLQKGILIHERKKCFQTFNTTDIEVYSYSNHFPHHGHTFFLCRPKNFDIPLDSDLAFGCSIWFSLLPIVG